MSKPLTEWIAERRETESKATPGPWFWYVNRKNGVSALATPKGGTTLVVDTHDDVLRLRDHARCVMEPITKLGESDHNGKVDVDHPDANCIIDARNNHKDMLDLIEAQAKVIEHGGKPRLGGPGFGPEPLDLAKWKPAYEALLDLLSRMGLTE